MIAARQRAQGFFSFPVGACLGLFLVLGAAQLLAAKAPEKAREASGRRGAPIVFETDIRPILKENCFDCHGEGEKPKGGLDTRLRRSLAQGGESGPALVPGDPKRSLIIERLV